MDLLLIVTIVCASTLTLTFFILRLLFNQTPHSTKLPPGPTLFGIIRNFLELGRNPHITLAKLSKIYGPIMAMKLGKRTTIVISSPQLAKQVLQGNAHAFSSRTIPYAMRVFDHHVNSITFLPPSEQWRNLRRFCATKMFSPQMLDSTKVIRQQKLKELLDFAKNKSIKGEVMDLGEAIFSTVLNSISNTLFSMDLTHTTSDDKSREFNHIISGSMEDTGKPNIVDFFPILLPLDPQRIQARMTAYLSKLFQFIDGIIGERMSSRVSKTDIGSEVGNDVLDSMLNNIGATSQLSRNEILHLFVDLFAAGIDTTVVTIEWAMAELLCNPQILGKAREELRQVIGEDATIEESHISKLPYLQAIVKETFRLHPATPFLVPRKCDEDASLSGFQVPKDAQVLVNVWGMGQDPTIWKNPTMFQPDRFLESEITFKGQNFELIPFGAGKRICVGMPLADRSIHLIVASLVHNFEWKLADGLAPEHINMEEHFGLSLRRAHPLRVQPISVKHS